MAEEPENHLFYTQEKHKNTKFEEIACRLRTWWRFLKAWTWCFPFVRPSELCSHWIRGHCLLWSSIYSGFCFFFFFSFVSSSAEFPWPLKEGFEKENPFRTECLEDSHSLYNFWSLVSEFVSICGRMKHLRWWLRKVVMTFIFLLA